MRAITGAAVALATTVVLSGCGVGNTVSLADTGVVTGTIDFDHDLDHEPVALPTQATVQLTTGSRMLAEVSVPAGGHFRFIVPSGLYTVRVREVASCAMDVGVGGSGQTDLSMQCTVH